MLQHDLTEYCLKHGYENFFVHNHNHCPLTSRPLEQLYHREIIVEKDCEKENIRMTLTRKNLSLKTLKNVSFTNHISMIDYQRPCSCYITMTRRDLLHEKRN